MTWYLEEAAAKKPVAPRSTLALSSTPHRTHPLTWAIFDDLAGAVLLVGTGAVLVIAGGALIGEGVATTATGPGALVGIPSVVLGAEAVSVGVVSTGAGFWLFYETVWTPVKEAVFGP